MKLAGYLTAMRRESRGSRGRLLFFTGCLAVGVAAVVGVGVLVGLLDEGVRRNARQLLAADMVVSARRPLPEELGEALAQEVGLERTDVRELATVVSSGPRAGAGASDEAGAETGKTRSRLTELKVVKGQYPFYGDLVLDPPGSLGAALDAESVVVAPELLAALQLSRGDELLVGGASFRIAASVVSEPDRMGFSLTLGPRVFMTAEGLERTALLGVGNRVRYKALLRAPGAATGLQLAALEGRLREALPDAGFLRFETFDEAQPTLRRALERVEDYLGLVALLSLLLGGVGVAQIVRTWMAERTEGVAVLRCLGMRPWEILWLYVAQVCVLALAGSVLGALLGTVFPYALLSAVPDVLPPGFLGAPPVWPVLRGLALGMGVALVFSLPPLLAVWRVPPARVLRADAAPLPAPRWMAISAVLVLLLGLFGSAFVQSGDWLTALIFTGGLVVLIGLLALGARTLMRASRALPRERMHPYLAHGVAALSRPGAGTVGAVVALGLGVLVVLAMLLVEGRLAEELRTALPEEAPSSFLVDVQPDQWMGVRAAMLAEGAEAVDSVPVVMARLAEIDGTSVADLLARRRVRRGAAGGEGEGDGSSADAGSRSEYESENTGDSEAEREGGGEAGRDGGSPRWVLSREQRLTWRQDLPADNRILEGELWSDPERAEVSLEEGFAEDLGVGVGSELVFDIQGVLVDVLVSSIRSVEWRSFSINFFVIVEPGLLESAPHFRIAAARLSREGENALEAQLVERYPNVTLLRVRDIIEKVGELLGRLALGIRLLGGFTALAGVVILAGAVASTSLRRSQEVALLKTMGVTRGGVAALFATEYALSGLLAGCVGSLGAYALAWAFLEHVADLGAELPWAILPVAILLTGLLAVSAGLAASGRALRVPPVESLRR